MSTKPDDRENLLESLRRFLEAFTQDLTEQKFIPAFRDELSRLLSSLENLQQSEDTLQQIARGVERLREVFAPAGTRLLESAREVESVLRSNAAELKSQASVIIERLSNLHKQLESSLLSEAGLLSQQTATSREALVHATADVEERLTGLQSRIEDFVRQTEQRIATATQSQMTSAPLSPASTSPVQVDATQIREAVAGVTESLRDEIARYRDDFSRSLMTGAKDYSERLAQLSQEISDSLAGLGPHIQDELRQAVTLATEQLAALSAAKAAESPSLKSESGGKKAEQDTTVPAAVLAAFTASENRILHELSELRKLRKQEWSHALDELHAKITQIYETETARQTDAARSVNDSLDSLKQLLTSMHAGQVRMLEEWEQAAGASNETVRVREQLESLDKFVREVLPRIEESHRYERETAEAAFRELRSEHDAGFASIRDQQVLFLRQLIQSWQEELGTLKDSVKIAVSSVGDALTDQLRAVHATVNTNRKTEQADQQTLRNELARIVAQTSERFDAIRDLTAQWVANITARQDQLSQQIESLMSRHHEGLQVLRDAVRENYDDSASRLKQVIETAFDNFIKQASAIPQALDSYTRLIQSLHQADQIALQAITSDTTNLLNLSAEKFDLLLTDSTAMKKFFPLLDRKLEKHAAELDALRKAQIRQDKDFSEIKESLHLARKKQEDTADELRGELRELHSQTSERVDVTRAEVARIAADLKLLEDNDLPAFRRDLTALLTSKFDFMETTTREREDALKNELFSRLQRDRSRQNRIYLLLGLLIVLGMFIHFGLVSLVNSGRLP